MAGRLGRLAELQFLARCMDVQQLYGVRHVVYGCFSPLDIFYFFKKIAISPTQNEVFALFFILSLPQLVLSVKC